MTNSPFKFLNAYQREDLAFFFGRQKETEEIYNLTKDSRLILIVGASGTGKTSIIQCGLANKFKRTRWNGIYIRRGNDLNNSLEYELAYELVTMGGNLLGNAESILDKLKFINQITFKPIYLIFDQFEELFVIDPNEREQELFFSNIKKIIASPIPVKVLLVMRDEFSSHLWKHEKILPTLFKHRYRIERMRSAKMEEVIISTLKKYDDLNVIRSKERAQIAHDIIAILMGSKAGLKLTYLQVYLDRLYQEAEKKGENPPLFTPQLVDNMVTLEDIVGDFLYNQITILEQQLGPEKKGIPIRLLGEMITAEKTKKVLDAEELEEIRIQLDITKKDLRLCIEFFQNRRILKQFD